MKYINRLTNEQIEELISDIWYKEEKENNHILDIDVTKYSDIVIIQTQYYISDGGDIVDLEETMRIWDYDIETFDFIDHKEHEHIIQYRKKMLEYFGEQYAIDYLLGE